MSVLRNGTLRLGDLLVLSGVLTPQQRDEVLCEQRLGGRPFGEIAELLFGVSPAAVESAWAQQVSDLAPHVDPRSENIDPYALRQIGRRQAWQFSVLPIRFIGEELVICTTQDGLPRALKFVGWRLGTPSRLVIADPELLGEALERHYPMSGMTAAALRTRRLAS